MEYYIFNASNLKDYSSNIAYFGSSYFLLISGHGGTNIGEKAASIVLKKIISYLNLEEKIDKFKFIESVTYANNYLIEYALKNNLHKLIGASLGIYSLKDAFLYLNAGVCGITFNYNGKLKLYQAKTVNNIPNGFLGLSKKLNYVEQNIDVLKESIVILMPITFLRYLTKDKLKNIIDSAKLMYNSNLFCRFLAQNIFNEAKKLGFTQDASIVVVKN